MHIRMLLYEGHLFSPVVVIVFLDIQREYAVGKTYRLQRIAPSRKLGVTFVKSKTVASKSQNYRFSLSDY